MTLRVRTPGGRYLVVFGAAIIAIAIAAQPGRGSASASQTQWPGDRFIAHGLGNPHGSDKTYCNCLEGFEDSYAQGFRMFEADVIMATDGIPFAYHGGFWSRLGFTHQDGVRRATSKTLRDRRVDGLWMSLDGPRMIDLLIAYDDAYLALHTKFDSWTETPAWMLKHAPKHVRHRIVPYVWRDHQLKALHTLGAKRFIVPTHANLGMNVAKAAAFAKKHGLDTVVGSAHLFTADARALLKASGVRNVYADRGWRRTLDPNEEDVLMARLAKGLGVYSDKWIW